MTTEAPANIPPDISYAEAEVIARRMSDLDLIRVARSLSFPHGSDPELAASVELNRRFEQLRERAVSLNHSLEVLRGTHQELEERFESLVLALQQALALLVGGEGDPSPPGER